MKHKGCNKTQEGKRNGQEWRRSNGLDTVNIYHLSQTFQDGETFL